MAGIEVSKPIGTFAVPPCHAIDDTRPDEGDSRVFHHSLTETGTHDLICHTRSNLDWHHTVRECQITIDARIKAANSINQQVGFKGMTAPGGRNIAKSGVWFVPLHNPLCTPEKVSEFL